VIPYLVCQFSKPTVSNLVKECFGSDFPDILKKPQLNYIYHYLKELGAKSVLLEREYLDKDYLEDFSRYYVKCFKNSGHKCARLHFFDSEINHTSFNEILKKGSSSKKYEALRKSYLGFIVIKPLQETFIGKTCLKQWPSLLPHSPDEKKCLSRQYTVNLFGIDLEVESVAFQEQDKVISACATTAIYTALHGCSWQNEKQIPSSSEITINAINHTLGSSNGFPNKGLTNEQILRALDIAGFRYHKEAVDQVNASELFDTVRCYIDSNVPIILAAQINYLDNSKKGDHAITILGYAKEAGNLSFYVHDDRLGPFAKAKIKEVGGKLQLVLQGKNSDGEWLPPHEIVIPSTIIIPTQKKVRIPYSLPMNTCRLIIETYEGWLLEPENVSLQKKYSNAVTYSLRLYQLSEIRRHILDYKYASSQNDLNKVYEDKAHFLTKSYARFQWVASFYMGRKKAFKLLFDATDIPQGNAVSGIFIENQAYANVVLDILRKYDETGNFADRKSSSFFPSVLKYLRPSKRGLYEHLDEKYGELRAPRYLKEAEFKGGVISINNSVVSYYETSDLSLDDIYPDIKDTDCLIWAIAEDGSLLLGNEVAGKGHPTLTRFKPARIAGELRNVSGSWVINSKSGRYSKDYSNSTELLENALKRFKGVFCKSRDDLSIESAIAL
jgi:hypothetical protein